LNYIPQKKRTWRQSTVLNSSSLPTIAGAEAAQHKPQQTWYSYMRVEKAASKWHMQTDQQLCRMVLDMQAAASLSKKGKSIH